MRSCARAGFNKASARPVVKITAGALLAVLILGLFTAPLAAEAQEPGKVYRIGYLQTSTREEQLHMVKAFEDGLRSRHPCCSARTRSSSSR